MDFNYRKQQHHLFLLLFILVSLIQTSCKQKPEDQKKIRFGPVIGIHYTEVRRRLNTGRSFDNHGYEVSPTWKMFFLPKDSAGVFSPDSNRFLTFPVTIDHDSLFNVANTWLKAKIITKDSLVFQVLAVEGKMVRFARSTVYMTFYADDYIKTLKTSLVDMQKTDHADTLFVQKMAAQANKYPDSLFAARVPVVLQSRSPFVKVEKEKVIASRENRFDTSESYLDPVYDITIHHAYQDFGYSFTVLVDTNGQMHFRESLVYIFPEFKESTIRVIKGIIDGYLKVYIAAKPGNTLGITHNSLISLYVAGRKK